MGPRGSNQWCSPAFTLCHSRMPFVRVHPRETQEMEFDADDWAFARFKGAGRVFTPGLRRAG